jgi:predicted TIM-barrel fold metal-dependent hydrolase
MIIDSNTHITKDFKWFNTSLDASVDSLLSSMNQNNIHKSLILPLPGVTTNEYVREICFKYPDRFIEGSSFNPGIYSTPEESVSNFKKEIIDNNFKIVKFHNRLGGYGLSDSRYIETLKFNNLLENPIPVAICSIFHDKNQKISVVPPNFIFDLSQELKNTKFLIMHGGGAWIFKVAEMIRNLNNVYLDLSYTISKYRESSIDLDIKWLCNNFDQRITWGSDSPEFTQKKALLDFYEISDGISPSKVDNILGNNLLTFLK